MTSVMKDDKTRLYTYRYSWILKKDDKQVNVKVVTDVAAGLVAFEKRLLEEFPDVYAFAREYLQEIDLSKMSIVESIVNRREN